MKKEQKTSKKADKTPQTQKTACLAALMDSLRIAIRMVSEVELILRSKQTKVRVTAPKETNLQNKKVRTNVQDFE